MNFSISTRNFSISMVLIADYLLYLFELRLQLLPGNQNLLYTIYCLCIYAAFNTTY